jgi:hypothetical protein
MKRLWIIAILATIACEGKLTDEQRKRMREQMELHKIKRVTEVEITEAAYAKGRAIISALDSIKMDSVKVDSFLQANEGRIRWIEPGKSNAIALEQQLVDAYLADESGGLQDNIQKVRHENIESDSILYTKPVVVKMQDGSERLEGVWNIWLSKKQLILAMDK